MTWFSNNWLFVVLAIGVLLFLMRGRHMAFGGHRSTHHHADGDGDAPPIDPVSGETVTRDGAVATFHRGRAYYFASRENRERFEAEPDKYAAPQADDAKAQRHRRHGGCC